MLKKLGLVLLASLLAPACGGDAVSFDGTGGEGGAGASGGGGGQGGDGGSGGQCALYDDEAGSEVTFRIHNDSSQDIYLPTNCGMLAPIIEPLEGDDETHYGNPGGGCFASCEDYRQGAPPVCAAVACAEIIVRLEPGQSHDFVWLGTGLRSETMPEACWFDEGYGSECTRVVEAPEASYQFEVLGYAECLGDCSCQDNGQCFGQAGGAEGFHDVTTFAHPAASLVEVVFGPCAFGCADPTP